MHLSPSSILRSGSRARRLGALAMLTASSVAAALTTDVSPAHAAPTAGYGFVWADQPTSASYTPHTLYQANSTGAWNTAARESTGVYVVTMPNLGTGEEGNVQVSAYGASGTQRCKVSDWSGQGSALKIRVRCFTTGGSPADSQYVVQYQAQTSSQSYSQAWVWADNSTATSYTPNLSWQWNSTGATNTISRTATGKYTVNFPGQPLSEGNIQVTAYGTSSAYCKVESWGGTQAYVGCYTTSGSPTNTQFTAAFTSRRGATGPVWTQFAYVWGNNASSTSYYTPLAPWTVNSRGGNVQARKTGTGVYEVILPGQPGFGGTIANSLVVTAYGSSANTCRISNWITTGSAGSGSVTAYVRCYTPSGSPVDSQYSLLFAGNTPV